MALVNHDALLAERKGMSLEESETHYIKTEMLDPLVGGVIVGGFVDSDFPVLRVMIKGKVYQVVVSMDDEMNGGGRLMIDEEIA